MSEIVNVVLEALALGYIAAGAGDAVAQLDDLDVEPGGPDHFVVEEDFAGERYSGADDLPVLYDEPGGDHERANLGKDFPDKTLALGIKPPFRIGVDVAETEVDNFARGIGDAVKDVEVVEAALRRCQKSVMLLSCDGRTLPHAAQVRHDDGD